MKQVDKKGPPQLEWPKFEENYRAFRTAVILPVSDLRSRSNRKVGMNFKSENPNEVVTSKAATMMPTRKPARTTITISRIVLHLSLQRPQSSSSLAALTAGGRHGHAIADPFF
jgi:hypothetical protein